MDETEPATAGMLDEAEASSSARSDDPPPAAARRSGVTFDQLVLLFLAVVGARIGLEPLKDNSFFTHLATGRLIVEQGAIPRADPYSFTALGAPWTVQSWGASAVYGGLERAFGLVGIRVLVAACTTLMAVSVWRLTRPARLLVPRLVLAVPAVVVGAAGWVERPLLFGLVFFVVVLLAIEAQLDPRWLVPVLFVWVNVHGSFPLALVAIGAFGLGRLLDRERPVVELRAFGWASLGIVLGALNPLGLRLLVFPFTMLERREAFSKIEEWQSPSWEGWDQRAFALQLVLAAALLVWRGRSWRLIVPAVVFSAAALQSSRNIVQASLVLLPVMAVAAKDLGSIDGSRPLPILRPVRVALLALAVLVAVVGFSQPDVNVVPYPVDAAEWMRERDLLDLDSRVVTRDFVGNFLHARYGPDEVRVYMDDRVDMYPLPVIQDYLTLIDENGDYAAVLERAEATGVIWDKANPFGDWLQDPANGWEIVQEDERWMVALPQS